MVPMRYVGGTGLYVVTGMGMQSVFPVPTVSPINAFPEVFGHIACLVVELWRIIAATV